MSDDANINKFGGIPRRKYSVPQDEPDTFDEELVAAADEILPPIDSGPQLEYRISVVARFVKHDPEPRKRKKGQPYRTEAESRLDRAFTQVAEGYDRCESTIRDACTRGYDNADVDSPTEAFREDCVAIMNAIG